MTAVTDLAPVPSEHGAECGCTHCVGFQPGNEVGLRHGAYSLLKIGPRAQQIADDLRDLVPLAGPADSAAIDVLSTVLAQLELASLALSIVQRRDLDLLEGRGDPAERRERRDDLRRLAADARGWANTSARRPQGSR